MKDILFNLALIDTINFCKANNIDCSGSHLVKHTDKKYTYVLVHSANGLPIVDVVFHKSSVPTHSVYNNVYQK